MKYSTVIMLLLSLFNLSIFIVYVKRIILNQGSTDISMLLYAVLSAAAFLYCALGAVKISKTVKG